MYNLFPVISTKNCIIYATYTVLKVEVFPYVIFWKVIQNGKIVILGLNKMFLKSIFSSYVKDN